MNHAHGMARFARVVYQREQRARAAYHSGGAGTRTRRAITVFRAALSWRDNARRAARGAALLAYGKHGDGHV